MNRGTVRASLSIEDEDALLGKTDDSLPLTFDNYADDQLDYEESFDYKLSESDVRSLQDEGRNDDHDAGAGSSADESEDDDARSDVSGGRRSSRSQKFQSERVTSDLPPPSSLRNAGEIPDNLDSVKVPNNGFVGRGGRGGRGRGFGPRVGGMNNMRHLGTVVINPQLSMIANRGGLQQPPPQQPGPGGVMPAGAIRVEGPRGPYWQSFPPPGIPIPVPSQSGVVMAPVQAFPPPMSVASSWAPPPYSTSGPVMLINQPPPTVLTYTTGPPVASVSMAMSGPPPGHTGDDWNRRINDFLHKNKSQRSPSYGSSYSSDSEYSIPSPPPQGGRGPPPRSSNRGHGGGGGGRRRGDDRRYNRHGRRSRSPRDRRGGGNPADRDLHTANRAPNIVAAAQQTEEQMRATALELGLDPDDYIKRLRIQQQLRETKLREKELRREQQKAERASTTTRHEQPDHHGGGGRGGGGQQQARHTSHYRKQYNQQRRRSASSERRHDSRDRDRDRHHRSGSNTKQQDNASPQKIFVNPKVHFNPAFKGNLGVKRQSDEHNTTVNVPTKVPRAPSPTRAPPASSSSQSQSNESSVKSADPQQRLSVKQRLAPKQSERPSDSSSTAPRPSSSASNEGKQRVRVAVVTNFATDTTLERMQIIGDTCGKVKSCVFASPSKIVLVFEDTQQAVIFMERYNGRVIGGAKVKVHLQNATITMPSTK